MNDLTATWTHNPSKGNVTGIIKTKPKRMDFILEKYGQLIVTAIIADSCNREWRVKTKGSMATKLLACEVGQKLKITGIKGNLCKGNWDNAKRQIEPSQLDVEIFSHNRL